ncbi:hypothetical protein F1880_001774 [Penicillium rolfsii]|nr:hypothetical protein F1880_001774 [Penicillium rolfsii]
MEVRDLDIWGRKSRVDPEPEPIPTVRVITETIPGEARRAAKEIHYALLNSSPPLPICVDIMDTLLATPLRSFPVFRTDSVFDKWDDIVTAILNASDTREWIALGCFRYGVSTIAKENPVTVVVTVQTISTSEWSTALRRIQVILSVFGLTDVDILFRKDKIRRHVENPDLPQTACSKFVQPGVSLGIHSSTAESSTLGGLVELQFPDKKWRTSTITCFHSVYAPEQNRETLGQVKGAKEAFQRWKQHPVFPQDPMARHLLRVDHPSLGDLRRAVASRAQDIADLKDNEFRRIEQQISARDTDPDDVFDPKDEAKYKARLHTINFLEQQHQFFQSYIQNKTYLLGSVFAGSGYSRTRTLQDQRQVSTIVDWALIEIPKERLGKNMPYSYSRVQKPSLTFDDGGYLEHGKSYSKVGRSSGFTTGVYSELREAHLHYVLNPGNNTYNPTMTMEHYLCPPVNTIIAEPGDSGSLVYDAKTGRVVELHNAGANGTGHLYFTPIHDVYRDIMEVTGAINVRMA